MTPKKDRFDESHDSHQFESVRSLVYTETAGGSRVGIGPRVAFDLDRRLGGVLSAISFSYSDHQITVKPPTELTILP